MSVQDDQVTRTLRNQAWERAKGELQSVLVTYWQEIDKCEDMYNAVERFVEYVEDNGLHE